MSQWAPWVCVWILVERHFLPRRLITNWNEQRRIRGDTCSSLMKTYLHSDVSRSVATSDSAVETSNRTEKKVMRTDGDGSRCENGLGSEKKFNFFCWQQLNKIRQQFLLKLSGLWMFGTTAFENVLWQEDISKTAMLTVAMGHLKLTRNLILWRTLFGWAEKKCSGNRKETGCWINCTGQQHCFTNITDLWRSRLTVTG